MQLVKVHRGAVLLSGLFLFFLFFGGAWISFNEIYNSYESMEFGAKLVELNVIALWVPVGVIGIALYSLVFTVVALVTGVRADFVLGRKGILIANNITVFFAILGMITAVAIYQWMNHQLSERGYVYCSLLTRVSATGKHEVYVSSPELCVKPSKIP
jgi:ABC-type uncharacterized transport system fused permease/ATPase subunit